MLDGCDLIAFAPTADLARARAFYTEMLQLPIVSDDGFALVVDAGGTTLRVTLVGEVADARYTVLGWKVADIAAAVEELARRGVVFERYEGMDQDALGIWRAPSGDLVAWFHDPDGNTLSLSESCTRPGEI